MNLFYRDTGSGIPVLIMHGLFGCADNWNLMAKKISSENYRVITVDLRNHGLSPHHEEWDYHCMAEDVKELCEKLNLKKVIFIGHSMGGKVAMYLSAICSHLIKAMVVVDIAPRYYPPHHHEILEALLSVNLPFLTNRNEAADILSNRIHEAGVVQFLLKNLYRKDDNGQAIFAWRMNLATIVKNISVVGAPSPFPSEKENQIYPVLFIRGEVSDYIVDKDRIDILSRYPAAEIITIMGAGHWVQAEKPEEFFTCLLEWLRRKDLVLKEQAS